MVDLVRLGVPLSIWGDNGRKIRNGKYSHDTGVGRASTIRTSMRRQFNPAKICLGLVVSVVNDLKTLRTFEIPALGGLLCAERTPEHVDLYDEGIEAIFWKGSRECADACLALLADKPRRDRIAQRGRERALRSGYYNERVLAEILDIAVFEAGDRAVS